MAVHLLKDIIDEFENEASILTDRSSVRKALLANLDLNPGDTQDLTHWIYPRAYALLSELSSQNGEHEIALNALRVCQDVYTSHAGSYKAELGSPAFENLHRNLIHGALSTLKAVASANNKELARHAARHWFRIDQITYEYIDNDTSHPLEMLLEESIRLDDDISCIVIKSAQRHGLIEQLNFVLVNPELFSKAVTSYATYCLAELSAFGSDEAHIALATYSEENSPTAALATLAAAMADLSSTSIHPIFPDDGYVFDIDRRTPEHKPVNEVAFTWVQDASLSRACSAKAYDALDALANAELLQGNVPKVPDWRFDSIKVLPLNKELERCTELARAADETALTQAIIKVRSSLTTNPTAASTMLDQSIRFTQPLDTKTDRALSR